MILISYSFFRLQIQSLKIKYESKLSDAYNKIEDLRKELKKYTRNNVIDEEESEVLDEEEDGETIELIDD
jgi:hypothetical protein